MGCFNYLTCPRLLKRDKAADMSPITSILGMRDTNERKRLKGKEHGFGHMRSTELAANLFCATQTEEKLRRENVRNKDHASRIHNEVGRKVRQTIHELGGTMPGNLPVAENIKKVESREKKRLRAEQKKALQSGAKEAR